MLRLIFRNLIATSFWVTAAAPLLAACGGGSSPVCARDEQVFEGRCVEICSQGEERDSAGECQQAADVALNSVGFDPTSLKLLSFMGGEGEFSVVDATTEEVVFTQTVEDLSSSADFPEGRLIGDFSEVTEPGTYFVQVGDAQSQPFEIRAGIYERVFEATMLGFYGQRCGTSVEFSFGGETFEHGACHLEDAQLLDGTEMESVGGWHDAGDYGKYVSNGAFSVGHLLRAWEDFGGTLGDLQWAIPEEGGDVPDLLDEVKWELDWMLTTQLEDGSTSHKVTAFDFEGFILPETDNEARFHAPPGTVATASFAAVMAQAARCSAREPMAAAETRTNGSGQ
jgi:endoglucanase